MATLPAPVTARPGSTVAGAVLVRTLPLAAVPDELAERWRTLADRALEPNPFAGPDLARAAAAHLPGGADAWLLVAERAGEVVFALPVLRATSYRHLPLPTLHAWRHAHSFLGTPLLAPDDAVAVWRAVLDTARRQRWGAWFVLDDLPVDGPVAAALREATCEATTRRPRLLEVRDRPVAHPRCDPERPGRTGRNAARRRRRLAADLGGPAELCPRATTAATVRDFLALEADGWKGGSAAMGTDPRHAAFFADLCRSPGMSVLALARGEETAALLCVLRSQDAAFLFKIAHARRLAERSPGVMLLDDALDGFRAEGLARVDSCTDDAAARVADLFAHRARMATVLVPVRGPGVLVAPWVSALVALYRAAKRSRIAASAGFGLRSRFRRP